MKNLENNINPKLNLLIQQDNKFAETYENFLKEFWKGVDLFFDFDTENSPELKYIQKDFMLYIYKDELENIFNQILDFLIEDLENISNRNKNKNDLNNHFEENLFRFNKIISHTLSFIRKNIESRNRSEQILKYNTHRLIESKNTLSLLALDEQIKLKLFENSLTGQIKLDNITTSFFSRVLDETLGSIKNEGRANCLSADKLCKKINQTYLFNWKRASFERYCKKNNIRWKTMAKSKGIIVCKEKPSSRKDKIS